MCPTNRLKDLDADIRQDPKFFGQKCPLMSGILCTAPCIKSKKYESEISVRLGEQYRQRWYSPQPRTTAPRELSAITNALGTRGFEVVMLADIASGWIGCKQAKAFSLTVVNFWCHWMSVPGSIEEFYCQNAHLSKNTLHCCLCFCTSAGLWDCNWLASAPHLTSHARHWLMGGVCRQVGSELANNSLPKICLGFIFTILSAGGLFSYLTTMLPHSSGAECSLVSTPNWDQHRIVNFIPGHKLMHR